MRCLPALANLALFSLLCPAALAQGATEFRLTGDGGLVLAPSFNSVGPTAPETALFELGLNARADHYLADGTRLRLNTSLRLQKDHPARPGFSGGFGADPDASVGAFSGLSAQAPYDQDSLKARLEQAYLQVDGGYGEARLGKDLGVAARFYEGAPDVLRFARLDSPLLDPSGIGAIRTRHDLTGPSAKLSYASPRWIGVRAGLSYTPEASADGLDRRPEAGATAPAPQMDNAFELALNTVHRLRTSDTKIETALAWSSAEISSAAALPYERAETLSAGARLSRGDWSFGGAWLGSNNGLENGDYSAWSLGLGTDQFGLEWAINYGEADDDAVALSADGWRAGFAKEIGPDIRLALAYTQDNLDIASNSFKNHGIVIEITLFREILDMSRN